MTDRVVPWRRQGRPVEGAETAAEALGAAGLAWDVRLEPVLVQNPDFESPDVLETIPDRFANVRQSDRRVLGIVGSDYRPFQNTEAFAFADHAREKLGAAYESAGELKGGRWVWATLKLPGTVRVGGEDVHDLYLMLNNSHDGSRAVTVAVTPIRLDCTNLLNLALAKALQRWTARHVESAVEKLKEAIRTVERTEKYVTEFTAVADQLVGESCSTGQLEFVLRGILPDTERSEFVAERIIELFETSPTIERVRGTKWAAVNAVGEWFDWVREPRTAESQLLSTLIGTGKSMRDRAVSKLLQVA